MKKEKISANAWNVFILLALAPDYLSNSTVLVRSGQEAKQGLFQHGSAHGETPTESLYCIGSDNGKAMPAPPTGSATSGRKQRQHAEKGRTDEPARKRVHAYKIRRICRKPIYASGTQQTYGKGALHEEIIHSGLFWEGLSMICNLYGYNKLHA